MQPAKRLLFMGAPGAGKGTYASRIAPMLGIPTISTGDILREEIKTGTKLGKEVQHILDAGKLVPNDLMIDMVKHRLSKPDVQDGFLLDGFPRTQQQAEALESFGHIDLAVNIYLPERLIVEKLLGRRVCRDCGRGYNVADIDEGEYVMPPLLPKKDDCDTCFGNPDLIMRDDDTEDVIRHRLEVYKQDTAPLLDYYSKSDRLLTFEVKKGVADMPELCAAMGIEQQQER